MPKNITLIPVPRADWLTVSLIGYNDFLARSADHPHSVVGIDGWVLYAEHPATSHMYLIPRELQNLRHHHLVPSGENIIATEKDHQRDEIKMKGEHEVVGRAKLWDIIAKQFLAPSDQNLLRMLHRRIQIGVASMVIDNLPDFQSRLANESYPVFIAHLIKLGGKVADYLQPNSNGVYSLHRSFPTTELLLDAFTNSFIQFIKENATTLTHDMSFGRFKELYCAHLPTGLLISAKLTDGVVRVAAQTANIVGSLTYKVFVGGIQDKSHPAGQKHYTIAASQTATDIVFQVKAVGTNGINRKAEATINYAPPPAADTGD